MKYLYTLDMSVSRMITPFSFLLIFGGTYFLYHHGIHLYMSVAAMLLTAELWSILGDKAHNYFLYYTLAEQIWFGSIETLASSSTISRLTYFLVFTHGTILFSLILCKKVIGPSLNKLFFGYIFLLLASLLPMLHLNVFGHREHIILMGYMPYLCLRYSQLKQENITPSLYTRIFLGIFLGLTLCFKPYFALAILVPEIVFAIMYRSWRQLFHIENIISGGVVILYILTWYHLYPEHFKNMADLSGAMTAYTHTPLQIILYPLFAMSIMVFIGYKSRKPMHEQIFWVTMISGFLIVLLFQQRSYAFSQFPHYVLLLLWWASYFKSQQYLTQVIITMLFLLPLSMHTREAILFEKASNEYYEILQQHDINLTDKRVGLLTQTVAPANNWMAKHHVIRWNISANISYPSHELLHLDLEENDGVKSPAIKEMSEVSNILHNNTLALWRDLPPDYILLDYTFRSPLRFLEMDWEQFLKHDDTFQHIMQDYSLILSYGKRVSGVEFQEIGYYPPYFKLFKRKPNA